MMPCNTICLCPCQAAAIFDRTDTFDLLRRLQIFSIQPLAHTCPLDAAMITQYHNLLFIAIVSHMNLRRQRPNRLPEPPPPPTPALLPSLSSTNGMAALASSFSGTPQTHREGIWTAPRATASRLSYSPQSPQMRWISAGDGLKVRGGGGARAGSRTAGAAASLSASSSAEAVRSPVEKFRKDYQAPGHWTR